MAKWIYRIFNRTFGYVAVLSFAMLIVAIVLYGVLTKLLPPGDPAWADLRCFVGLSLQGDQECWAKRMERREAELEAERERERAEYARLRQEQEEALQKVSQRASELDASRRKLDDQLKKAEVIEERWNNINLFTTKVFMHGFVHTGVEYPSIIKGQLWVKSWCYFTEETGSAVSRQITLGKATPSGIAWSELSDAELKDAGMTQDNIKAANALCVCPAEVS